MGSLSQLSQMQSITMMAAAGEGGSLLVIMGTTSVIKMCQQSSHTTESKKFIAKENRRPAKIMAFHGNETPVPQSIGRAPFIPPIVKGKIYGKDAHLWNILNLAIADVVSEPPEIDWDAYDPFFKEPYRENYALLYIPEKIRVNEEVKDFDIGILNEMSQNPQVNLDPHIQSVFKKDGLSRWVLASIRVIPNSLDKYYQKSISITQTNMIEAQDGFRMAHALEAAVLCLMIHADTGEKLFGRVINPPFYFQGNTLIKTRCIETCVLNKNDWEKPISVGFNSEVLKIASSWQTGMIAEGVIAVKELI